MQFDRRVILYNSFLLGNISFSEYIEEIKKENEGE